MLLCSFSGACGAGGSLGAFGRALGAFGGFWCYGGLAGSCCTFVVL